MIPTSFIHLFVTALCLFSVTACGIKRDLTRPADIKQEEEQKQQSDRHGLL